MIKGNSLVFVLKLDPNSVTVMSKHSLYLFENYYYKNKTWKSIINNINNKNKNSLLPHNTTTLLVKLSKPTSLSSQINFDNQPVCAMVS